MCSYLKPTCYMNCSWSEQFFVKYAQFNNVSLFSVLIFIRVSQEERSVFWEVIVSAILSKNLYMNMCPIPNGIQDRAI